MWPANNYLSPDLLKILVCKNMLNPQKNNLQVDVLICVILFCMLVACLSVYAFWRDSA